MRLLQATLLSLLLLTRTWAIDKIAPNSTVYIEPMGGFDVFLSVAIAKKKVPITIITDKERAGYETASASGAFPAQGRRKLCFLGNSGGVGEPFRSGSPSDKRGEESEGKHSLPAEGIDPLLHP